MESSLEKVNAQFANESKNYDDNLRLKLHRALSWLNAADSQKENFDFCFISLWIAVNAIYANKLDDSGERDGLNNFLQMVCSLDTEKELYALVWNTFSDNVRLFLKNKFIFQPFWDEHNEGKNTENWKLAFDRENKRAVKAMAQQNTSAILHIVFRRLYTLRNQILHGGASFESSVNRGQKKEACTFLLNVLPIILKIIMEHYSRDWGKPYYPLVTE